MPVSLQGLGPAMASLSVWVLLALVMRSHASRRRAHAVHRNDDLGVCHSNSNAGEILAGRRPADNPSPEAGSSQLGEGMAGSCEQQALVTQQQTAATSSHEGHANAAAASPSSVLSPYNLGLI